MGRFADIKRESHCQTFENRHQGHRFLASLGRTVAAIETAGLEPTHVEGFRPDYARTLSEWRRNLDEHAERAESLAGPERMRVWRLYVRAARRGFEKGFTSIFQIVAHRPQ